MAILLNFIRVSLSLSACLGCGQFSEKMQWIVTDWGLFILR